jgi:alanine-alpha-ketoisovalerate/valine-pyruvate aminotransferase
VSVFFKKDTYNIGVHFSLKHIYNCSKVLVIYIVNLGSGKNTIGAGLSILTPLVPTFMYFSIVVLPNSRIKKNRQWFLLSVLEETRNRVDGCIMNASHQYHRAMSASWIKTLLCFYVQENIRQFPTKYI